MNWKKSYTRVFLNQLGYTVTDISIKNHMVEWWQNPREKEKGGMRLTDEGFRVMTEDLDIGFHEVFYAPELVINTQVLIWLDNFIDCPYYLGKKSMFVTDDKKALELHLFSGDIKKYGIAKAVARQESKNA